MTSRAALRLSGEHEVAVDAGLQGLGIGSRLLERYCAQVDAAGEAAYLETDKPINVRFYERFGFEVIGEQDVLGTRNWFMRRAPRSAREDLARVAQRARKRE